MCGSNHCDFCASISNPNHRNEFTVAPEPHANIYDPVMYPMQYQPQYNSVSYDYHKSGTKDAGSKQFSSHGKIVTQGNNEKYYAKTPSKLQVVPGASDVSSSTPTLSSASSKSDGSGTTLSGLSDLSSIKGPYSNIKENLEFAAKESDGSDIEEVPVPPKPTPPLVELDE